MLSNWWFTAEWIDCQHVDESINSHKKKAPLAGRSFIIRGEKQKSIGQFNGFFHEQLTIYIQRVVVQTGG